jgi:hypothetical protein
VNHRQQDNACENINDTSDNTMPSMMLVVVVVAAAVEIYGGGYEV